MHTSWINDDLDDLEPEIGNMKPGEEGYTVPWAMSVTPDNVAWLRPDYTIHNEHGGTVSLKVRRTRWGYVVDVSECTSSWKIEEDYGSVKHFKMIPINEVYTGRAKTTTWH